ncbi:MAG TPA: hypothetical protein VK665_12000 [Candidatus Elarobacter sp.]|nr:hypothetical protein [Candidatus Elarobacter sp.]
MILTLTLMELRSPLSWEPPPSLRDAYMALVYRARSNALIDFTDEYRTLVNEITARSSNERAASAAVSQLGAPSGVSHHDVLDYTKFNANDFANVHRVAWLLLGRALASLTNLNPHGDWGDPPPNGSAHPSDLEHQRVRHRGANFEQLNYHYVPNLTGHYAVSSADVATPNAGS